MVVAQMLEQPGGGAGGAPGQSRPLGFSSVKWALMLGPQAVPLCQVGTDPGRDTRPFQAPMLGCCQVRSAPLAL